MPTQTIFQIFQDFSWSWLLTIDESKNTIKIKWTTDFIFKKEWDFFHIVFYDFNKDTGLLEKREDHIDLFVHKSLNPIDFINHWENLSRDNYWYNFCRTYSIFKKIFEWIKSIKISWSYRKDLQIKSSILHVTPDKIKEILLVIWDIDKKSNSSRNVLLNYLINKSKFDFLNKSTKRTTSISKGDFELLVHRLNLSTKKSKKDFQNYFNTEDIAWLANLFDIMVRKEIFDKEYLKRLDDYFIKEKLDYIIKIWKEILNLKVEDVKTKEAKKLINKIFKQTIWQLETVWQKYFENYLLYLFFSYKKIIPKVELKNIDSNDKQYPDFIWVNHYDWVDIIEIKTHLKNIVVWDNSHKNFAFSPEMSKAIIQTINYMDAITDDKIKKSKEKQSLLEYLNIDENLYRPRWIIIISSSNKICKNQSKLTSDQQVRLKKDFTKLRNSIHNIQIFTFDEILEISERYIENIKINW